MTPEEWAATGRIKIERAKEHIANLEAEIATFIKSDNYRTVPDEDAETGDFLIRVRARREPPLRWGAVIGDAVNNLRAPLDILVYQRCWSITRTKPSSTVKFPVSETPEYFKTRDLPKVEGAGQSAVDFIEALKPYKGGNDGLWLLHRLDIANKHHNLVPVGQAIATWVFRPLEGLASAFGGLSLPFGFVMGRGDQVTLEGIKNPVTTQPLKDGAIVYRVPASLRGKVDMNPQFTFTVAFGETEVAEGEPVVETLHQLADLVDGIVEQFLRLPIP